MRTMIIAAAVATSTLFAGADVFYANPTNAEQCIANARAIASGSVTNRTTVLRTMSRAVRLDEGARLEIDTLLSQVPVSSLLYCESPMVLVRLPQTCSRVTSAVEGRFPRYAAYLRALSAKSPAPTELMLAGTIEGVMFGGVLHTHKYNLISRGMLRDAPRAIRVKLRSEGKAITSKDGVDPVNAVMEDITAALNAPRLAGLREAAAKAGFDIPQPEFAFIPTADSEEGKKFVNAVYIGDVSLNNDITATKLRYMLGTDGYNAFVERYNGGTR